MASSFNNDEPPGAPIAPTPETGGGPAISPATERFKSCRWRKPAEDGLPDHCTHRDVLPMAGTTGFVPDSWCQDCGFYKAKRSPRKRAPDEERSDWRW